MRTEWSGLARGFFVWGNHRRQYNPQQYYSIESTYLLGAVSTAAAVGRLRVLLGYRVKRLSLLVLLPCLIYLGVAVLVQSGLIWVCGILTPGGWFGAETGYVSSRGTYYLGMNYTSRFVPFGCVRIGVSHGCRFVPRIQDFERGTLACGLLYLFISLWIMLMVGHSSRSRWRVLEHWELFQWSVIFAASAVGAICHDLKIDDAMTRGFGITFLGINLYTRYFEYFWGRTHMAIFYILLAVSFWWLGSKAENIWQLGRGDLDGKLGSSGNLAR